MEKPEDVIRISAYGVQSEETGQLLKGYIKINTAEAAAALG